MVDIVDSKTRSKMMSGICSKNTSPEIKVRKALHKFGFRYRLNSKINGIKPDIVLKKYKVAIFIHGCYWHQHSGCKLAYADRNYSAFWVNKFKENIERDKIIVKKLVLSKWRVGIIWECLTRNEEAFSKEIVKIVEWIKYEDDDVLESGYKNMI